MSSAESKVAGRPQGYLGEWRKLTSDKFILNIVDGYRIPFKRVPIQTSFNRKTSFSEPQNKLFQSAINDLIAKGAITKCKEKKGQLLSPYFFREKADGSLRFILNLKQPNKYVHTVHFKLEDVRTATKLLSKGDYMTSIDLKDAFFLVPVHVKSRKFLRSNFSIIFTNLHAFRSGYRQILTCSRSF